MRFPVLPAGLLLALLTGDALSQTPVQLRHDEAHVVEVASPPEAESRWSLTYEVKASSVLHCHAESETMDVSLSIRSSDRKEVLRDDDSGGFRAAFVEVRSATAGEVITLDVEVEGAASGKIVVRVFEGPNVAEMDGFMNELASGFGRVRELIESDDHAAAGRLLDELVARTRRHDTLRIARAVLVPAATVAQGIGRHDLAVECLEKTLEWYRRSLSPSHPWLLACQSNIAVHHVTLGATARALPLFEAVVAAHEARGISSADRCAAVGQLASCLGQMGRHEEALPLFREIVASLGELVDAKSPQVLRARMNLAATLVAVGELGESVQIQRECVDIYRRTHPSVHRDRLLAECNLATNLRTLGFGEEALTIFSAVVAAHEKSLAGSPDRLWAESELAATLKTLGRVEDAAALLRDVHVRLADSPYAGNADFVMTRSALADSLRLLGHVEEALAHDRAVVRALSSLPVTDPRRLWATKGLAATLYSLGRFAEAATAMTEVMAAYRASLPAGHPYLTVAQSNLAAIVARQGRSGDAIALLRAALESEPRDARQLQGLKYSLAILLADTDQKEEALRMLRFVVAEWIGLVAEGDASLEDRSNLVAALGALGRREDAVDQCGGVLLRMTRTAARSAAERVVPRGGVEDRSLSLVLSCLHGTQTLAAECLRAIESSANAHRLHRSRIGDSTSDRIGRHRAEIRRLDLRIESILRSVDDQGLEDAIRDRARRRSELVRAIEADPASRRALLAPELDAIRSGLSPDAVAIRFITYDHWRYRGDPPRRDVFVGRHLAAFVLDSKGAVRRLDLGLVAKVDSDLERWRKSSGEARVRAASSLRRQVVDPLLEACGDHTEWVVALCPEINGLVMEALAPGPKPAGFTRRIVYRARLAELALDRSDEAVSRSLIVFGGLDFDEAMPAGEAGELFAEFEIDGGDAEVPVLSADDSPLARIPAFGAPGGHFGELEASAAEADRLLALHRRLFPETGRIGLTEDEGTRQLFEHLAPEAGILHLATHAYHDPEQFSSALEADPESPVRIHAFEDFLNSRSRATRRVPHAFCGVAFSGANLEKRGDGGRFTMSGNEISHLDLTGCDLVVLSACRGHDGEVSSAGVASLAEAFRIAGARTVIASLWPVADVPTKALMGEFYRQLWEEGRSKSDALRAAIAWMRAQKRPDGSPRHDVRDWAAWRLVGEPD